MSDKVYGMRIETKYLAGNFNYSTTTLLSVQKHFFNMLRPAQKQRIMQANKADKALLNNLEINKTNFSSGSLNQLTSTKMFNTCYTT
jgi:hypothetical protein